MIPRIIVAGTDGTRDSLHAAQSAEWLASRTGGRCHLVHAVDDAWMAVTPMDGGVIASGRLRQQSIDDSRLVVQQALEGLVSAPLAAGLEAAHGPPARVLSEAARRHHADLVVLGGRRRHGLDRLLHNTVTGVLRAADTPLLVTDRPIRAIARLLVATDLSAASARTLHFAQEWAVAFGASLRVLHVAEHLPPGQPRVFDDIAARIRREIVPCIWLSGTTITIRPGRATHMIGSEAQQWRADLLVLESHGKGLVDRLLIGSTSERMVQLLPAPTIIVPAGAAQRAGDARRMATAARTA